MTEDIIDSSISKINAIDYTSEPTPLTNTIKMTVAPSYAMECLICGESVDLTENEMMCVEYGKYIQPKICDKCRKAIIRMRLKEDLI